MKQKTCIVLLGPTAVGKTAHAISLAQHFNTAIISADSRQCYKELNIGVAKPSQEELRQVHHYFINSNSIQDDVNAKYFETFALSKAEEIFKTNNVMLMAGGTGMYINAFCSGLDEIPEIDPAIREDITNNYKINGMEWLQQQVSKEDPDYFSQGEIHNPQRLMRALEVKRSTGKSIKDFQVKKTSSRPFNIIKVGLMLPQEQLHHNINERVNKMMDAGLLNEVRQLLPFQHLNALQTVGYREIFDHLNGKISLERAVEIIKTNTRQYAKRQLTWLKKDSEIIWVNSHESTSAILDIIKSKI